MTLVTIFDEVKDRARQRTETAVGVKAMLNSLCDNFGATGIKEGSRNFSIILDFVNQSFHLLSLRFLITNLNL